MPAGAAAANGLPALAAYRTVIHYGRYSSRAQSKGTSEDRQADVVERWAEANGLTLTDRLMDRGKSGYSGAHRKRGDFGTLLEQAKAGQIPTPALVVLAEGDRAGREDVDVQLESLVLGLLRSGIDLYVVDSALHLNLERWRADLGAQIQLQAILHGANAYSRRLSARMKDAHARGREKVEAGIVTRPGWAPSWIEEHNGKWRFNSYEPTMRRLLELIGEQGYNATAKRLTEEGHRPPLNKRWTQGSVVSLVQSPAIAGGRIIDRRNPDRVAWDYYPALLSRAEWQALLARIASRNGSPAHGGSQQNINLISQGLTLCHDCGGAVGAKVCSYLDKKTGERRRIYYVRCRSRAEGKCDSPALRLEAVNAHILSRLTLSTLAALFPQQQASELSTLQAEATATRQQIEQQQAVAANGQQQISVLLASAPDAVPVVAQAVAAATRQAAELEQQLHQITRRIAALESDATAQLGRAVADQAAALLRQFGQGLDTAADRRALNQLMRRLGARITVDSNAERVAIAIGSGAPVWQPLNAATSRLAVQLGAVDVEHRQGEQGQPQLKLKPGSAAEADVLDTLLDAVLADATAAASASTAD